MIPRSLRICAALIASDTSWAACRQTQSGLVPVAVMRYAPW
jgi:hypothetical protein